MRFIVDLEDDGAGPVVGEVGTADRPPVPFTGWLELLRLLEDGARSHDDGRHDGQESTCDG